MAPVRSARQFGHCMSLLGAACLGLACGGQASYSTSDDSNDPADDALDHSESGGDDKGHSAGEAKGTGEALDPAQNMGTGGNGPPNDLTDLSGGYVLVDPIEYDFAHSVKFKFQDGDLMWTVGCNVHYGPYIINEGVLRIDWFEKSQADCGRELNNQESFLESFLIDGPQIYREGEHVIMTSPQYTLVLAAEDF